ncbi:MAG: protein translocase subunit SecF [Elusimicrobia bacterium]|nr:protein translocase subunit SecF [Elusimicrobiota bacterium]
MKTIEKRKPSPSNALPKFKFFELWPPSNIDFVRLRFGFYGLSAALVAATIFFLIARGGPPLGIDFTGGIVTQVKLGRGVTQEQFRDALSREELDSNVQSLGGGEYLARFKKEQENGLDEKLRKILTGIDATGSSAVLSKEFVGAVVGAKLRDQAALAIGLSFLGIIAYVGFRFRNLIWGLAGVIALVHDVLVTVGFLTLVGYEIDLVLVAALLTLAGYSINDTVVIFDRLRERMRIFPRESLREAINRSVNETMSRTIITAGATFLSVLGLAILGGRSLHPFSMALLFGIVIGSYSTFGVASNLVLTWAQWTGFRVR